ncbi:MAG: LLM class flavin-dependent oxidoreductase [Dehalococcoidia bacterium]
MSVAVEDRVDATLTLERAEWADANGYEAISIAEISSWEAFAMLGAIAMRTRHAALGTGMVSLYSRSIPIFAEALATLDDLAPGRVFLGLSTGARVWRGWHGTKGLYETPEAALRQYILGIRRLLQGGGDSEKVWVDSSDFWVLNLPNLPKTIPIYAGTLGEKALAVTREVADGWYPPCMPVDTVVRLAHEHLGDDWLRGGDGKPTIVYVIAAASEDRAEARAAARECVVRYTYFVKAIADRMKEDDEELVNAMLRKWQLGDTDEAVEMLPDAMLDRYSVSGTPAECRAALDRFFDAGVARVVVGPPPTASPKLIDSTIRALAP